jgi:DNA-binding beta-propeller fold protein YncE
MKLKSNYFLYLILMVAFSACETQPTITPEYPVILNPKGGLFILNEGNFQFSNATLDYYDFETQKLSTNAFETTNNRKLGDVLQSMTRYGDKGYLVVNNSQKIEVVNINTLSSLATINGFVSPRFMVINGTQKAYVSEYYNGGVKVVDLNTNQIVQTIPVSGNCDELLLHNNKLYVTVSNKKKVCVINTQSNVVMDSIDVAYGPNSLLLDKNNHLWVLSSGRVINGGGFENGALQKINTEADSVLQLFYITRQSDHGPIKLRCNGKKDVLYWINKSIYKHPINENIVSQNPWLPSFNNNFWALNYDSLTDEVYVGDAIDFVQRSTINRYDETATLRGTFKAGIITGDFYFYYK